MGVAYTGGLILLYRLETLFLRGKKGFNLPFFLNFIFPYIFLLLKSTSPANWLLEIQITTLPEQSFDHFRQRFSCSKPCSATGLGKTSPSGTIPVFPPCHKCCPSTVNPTKGLQKPLPPTRGGALTCIDRRKSIQMQSRGSPKSAFPCAFSSQVMIVWGEGLFEI